MIGKRKRRTSMRKKRIRGKRAARRFTRTKSIKKRKGTKRFLSKKKGRTRRLRKSRIKRTPARSVQAVPEVLQPTGFHVPEEVMPGERLSDSKLALLAFLSEPGAVLEFPACADPRISIVIVLYNKAELTLECLRSLQGHADVPYEVVIVDNGSRDETPELLARLRNARVLRNSDNAGFPAACNQGARTARGDWVMLLNNDAQITFRTLSSLLRTAESTPLCGAVGGKLISPVGLLQEAGSVLWNDGTCVGYGLGDAPDKPEYQYVREVDYCSGACLLVNKRLFEKAGWFDERYSPAYYEDTDLCMKIKEFNHKILYQPEAVVIHQAFGSSSHSAAMQLQVMNRGKFTGKWHHRLQTLQFPPEAGLLRARDGSRRKYKLLVMDDQIPAPELGTGFPRMFAILNELADLDFQVTFYPLWNQEPHQPCTSMLQQKGIEVMYALPGTHPDIAAFYSERRDLYDAVWISRPNNLEAAAPIIRSLNGSQKIIYDAEALYATRDIHYEEMQGNRMPEETRLSMIRAEVRLMESADLIVTVSENERRTIVEHSDKPVVVLGHNVEIRATPKPMEQRHDILFVGSFQASPSPNEDAMIHFVNDIYPEVRRRLGAQLWIVGTNHLDSVWSLNSEFIHVTGQVENLWDYYNNCRVFVAPTRYAAGISLKALGAMAHGIPVVTTPLIAGQLGLNKSEAYVGRHAAEFADKLIHCYTDPKVWSRLRDGGLQYIQRTCRREAFQNELKKLRLL